MKFQRQASLTVHSQWGATIHTPLALVPHRRKGLSRALF